MEIMNGVIRNGTITVKILSRNCTVSTYDKGCRLSSYCAARIEPSHQKAGKGIRRQSLLSGLDEISGSVTKESSWPKKIRASNENPR